MLSNAPLLLRLPCARPLGPYTLYVARHASQPIDEASVEAEIQELLLEQAHTAVGQHLRVCTLWVRNERTCTLRG